MVKKPETKMVSFLFSLVQKSSSIMKRLYSNQTEVISMIKIVVCVALMAVIVIGGIKMSELIHEANIEKEVVDY